MVEFSNTFVPTSWSLAKSSALPQGTVEPGALLTYTLTATNTGGEGSAPPAGVVVTDDLSDVLGSGKATFVEIDDAHLGTADFDPTTMTLTWRLDTLDRTQTLTYTVAVDEDARGVTLRNVVTGMGGVDEAGSGDTPPSSCAEGTPVADLEAECLTVHHTDPAWSLAKTSDDQDGKADPGQVITYTLTAAPVGSGPEKVSGLIVTDDLSAVLGAGKATFGAILDDDGSAVLGPDGVTLEWRIGELTEPTVLRYTVKVADDAFGVTLRNVVTGTAGEGSYPPATCAEVTASDPCTTVHATDPEPVLAGESPALLPRTGAALGVLVAAATALVGTGYVLVRRRRLG
ncbi:isopeptide-forming domain-containing fimbrial protein [Xylanimonas allomyrinae]|uniref:isopeptide-forming domain-containing fimbrial protein n=1 Tax=Xylanimonas allomyrinae TaxID=2509459 RepID=UPI0013A6212E|nr:isopeptide-forming domain-containing fimbrial protein [Xylanimonas allomyrinae]